MYIKAALVILPTQERKPRVSSQGPIVSALRGVGRRNSIQILKKSERSSTQLLTKNEAGTRGHVGENSAKYPN